LLLPDMIVRPGANGKGCLAEMMDVYRKTGGNIIGVEEVPPEDAHKFGIVAIGKGRAPVWPIETMVEKPKKGTTPSNLYIMGRYIIQPEIFALLERQGAGAGGEIQVTDALIALMATQSFHALRHSGRTFDCGSKIGFLAANVALGLADKEIGAELKTAIKALL
ncbi:MAG: UTP--glucose-1-phosphate uridylyltransferase, partial [Hyphomicrobiaceae bacterium]